MNLDFDSRESGAAVKIPRSVKVVLELGNGWKNYKKHDTKKLKFYRKMFNSNQVSIVIT